MEGCQIPGGVKGDPQTINVPSLGEEKPQTTGTLFQCPDGEDGTRQFTQIGRTAKTERQITKAAGQSPASVDEGREAKRYQKVAKHGQRV